MKHIIDRYDEGDWVEDAEQMDAMYIATHMSAYQTQKLILRLCMEIDRLRGVEIEHKELQNEMFRNANQNSKNLLAAIIVGGALGKNTGEERKAAAEAVLPFVQSLCGTEAEIAG